MALLPFWPSIAVEPHPLRFFALSRLTSTPGVGRWCAPASPGASELVLSSPRPHREPEQILREGWISFSGGRRSYQALAWPQTPPFRSRHRDQKTSGV